MNESGRRWTGKGRARGRGAAIRKGWRTCVSAGPFRSRRFISVRPGRLTVPSLLVIAVVFRLCLCMSADACLAADSPRVTSAGTIGTACVDRRYPVGFRVVELPYRKHGGRRLPVALWYPTSSTPRHHVYGGYLEGTVAVDGAPMAGETRWPVLAFSHGYGGCGIACTYLAEHVASLGWVVMAPDHHDPQTAATSAGGPNRDCRRLRLLLTALKIPYSTPSDRSRYMYRVRELSVAVDWLFSSSLFGALVDHDALAIGGHSMGGFPALALAGALPGFADTRVKALLLLSSGVGGYLYTGDELSRVKVPTMMFIGSREEDAARGNTTMGALTRKIFNHLGGAKYLLELAGAGHFTFASNVGGGLVGRWLCGSPDDFRVIDMYSAAFLERYVLDRPDAAPVLDEKDPRLSSYVRRVPDD